MQPETSHSTDPDSKPMFPSMNESEAFKSNMLQAMKELSLTEAELSVKAGLNRRAVTDIREGKTRSPKLSTVIALSNALGRDPAEMMGLGKRYKLRDDLARLLAEYSEEDQERLLSGLSVLGSQPTSEQ